MASRRYLVLGPVEAHLDGRVLPVASGGQTLLLATLLTRPDRVVAVESLVDSLWGERPPPGAAGTVRSLCSKLRRALDGEVPEPDLIVAGSGGYRLRMFGEHDAVDALRFDALLAKARTAWSAGHAEYAVSAYRRGIGLWRGRAFAGAAGNRGGAALLTAEARRLDAELVAATEEWLELEIELGRHARVLGELEALVAAEPLRERPHELLMLALYRSGRQHDALSVYRRLRRGLLEELGVEPSSAGRDLHQQLLCHDPVLDRRRDGSASRVEASGPRGSPTPGNLPVLRAGLVGRDEALARIVQVLTISPIATLTGTAGVGKSRLAVHVAGHRAFAARFPDGVWLVELAPLAADQAVAEAVTTVLGVQQRQGVTVLDRLVEYLQPKALLMVLDNCEHLLDSAAEVLTAVVRGCPNVVVLATSREPIGVDGEYICPVTPLPVPPQSAVAVAAIRQAPAVALFVARAQAAAPGFALSTTNAATVAEICRRLDGVPLAIELAATRMSVMTPLEVAERLEQRLEFLAAGPRAIARHRTLVAAIDWSYNLLDDAQQRIFDRLAVFAAGFTLDAAEHVVGGPGEPTAVAALLVELVDKSMVVAVPGEVSTRYRLLDTLRTYGRGRLRGRGEEQAVRHAHATYLAGFLEATARRFGGTEHAAAAESIAGELDNVRAAHDWAATNDLGLDIRIVAALFRFVEHRTPYEIPMWALRTVQAAEAESARHPALPTVYGVAARGATRRGDLARARVLAERGAAPTADPANAARRHPLYALGVLALFEGRLAEAARLTAEVEQLAVSVGDAWFAVRARTIRGLSLGYDGDVEGASALAERTCAMADASRDGAAIGWSRYQAAEALLESDPGRAAALLEEALRAAHAIDDRYLIGVALVSATSVRARHGDVHEAAELFREVIEHWHSAGNWTQQWTTIRNVVELLVRARLDEQAALLLGALDSTGTATPAFGTTASRLEAARHTLEDRIGPTAVAGITARGAALTPEQTLHVAREALHQVT